MKGFGDQPVHPVTGVETAIGILKDHLHFAADGKVWTGRKHRFAIQSDLSTLHIFHPQNGTYQRGFPATAFPHQTDPFAVVDMKTDIIERTECGARAKQGFAWQSVVSDDMFCVQKLYRTCTYSCVVRQIDLMPRCLKQCLGVEVLHIGEQILRRPCFNHAPLLHDNDFVGDIRDHCQIMRDQQQPHVKVLHQVLEQVENARLCRDIQGSCGFVCDQQLGAQGDGHGNNDPLTLAARQFMWIAGWRDF